MKFLVFLTQFDRTILWKKGVWNEFNDMNQGTSRFSPPFICIFLTYEFRDVLFLVALASQIYKFKELSERDE